MLHEATASHHDDTMNTMVTMKLTAWPSTMTNLR
jgi:hypothetical protein